MERLEKKVDAWQRKCKALREKGQKQIDYNKKLMVKFETNKRECERLKRMSDNLAGEVAEATHFDRSSVTVSPMQKRLNSVFDSIENEYARELRNEKKTRNDLVYNNSILKKKNDSLTKLLLNAKEGLRELLREREKLVAKEWRQKKSLESLKNEVKYSKKQKQDMEQDVERKQEQIEAMLESSEVVHVFFFFSFPSFSHISFSRQAFENIYKTEGNEYSVEYKMLIYEFLRKGLSPAQVSSVLQVMFKTLYGCDWDKRCDVPHVSAIAKHRYDLGPISDIVTAIDLARSTRYSQLSHDGSNLNVGCWRRDRQRRLELGKLKKTRSWSRS